MQRLVAEHGHLGFCLDEMLAEVDNQLAYLEATCALAQLDAREAMGQPLEVVCGKALRADLKQQIATHKLTAARRKLVELHALLTGPTVVEAAPVAADASATPAPVVDLASVRTAQATLTAPTQTSVIRRFGRVAALAGLLAISGLSSASYLGQLGRLPGFDLSAGTMQPTAGSNMASAF